MIPWPRAASAAGSVQPSWPASTTSPGSPTSRAPSPGSISAPPTRPRPVRSRPGCGRPGWRRRLDAVGNVVGRYEGERPGLPAVLLGSHIDTVRDAGRYDGNLGVLAAIEVVAELHAKGERLPFAIEVMAFGDEEGVRFPTTLTGSRAVAGTFDPATARRPRRGRRHACARRSRPSAATPPPSPAIARRPRAGRSAYVEVHIEQGPVLEAEGLPVGVVTAINGASRFAVEVAGRPATPAPCRWRLRRDALAAAAEMVLAVERRASAMPDLVGTVGRLEAPPGAVNVIPAAARFTLDLRAPDDAVRTRRRRPCSQRTLRAHRRAPRRQRSTLERTYDEPAARLRRRRSSSAVSAAVERAGVRPLRLPSGAGHDALAMAALCPIGMLFVRCKGGHQPQPAEVDHGRGRRHRRRASSLDFLAPLRAAEPESRPMLRQRRRRIARASSTPHAAAARPSCAELVQGPVRQPARRLRRPRRARGRAARRPGLHGRAAPRARGDWCAPTA